MLQVVRATCSDFDSTNRLPVLCRGEVCSRTRTDRRRCKPVCTTSCCLVSFIHPFGSSSVTAVPCNHAVRPMARSKSTEPPRISARATPQVSDPLPHLPLCVSPGRGHGCDIDTRRRMSAELVVSTPHQILHGAGGTRTTVTLYAWMIHLSGDSMVERAFGLLSGYTRESC